MASQELFNAIYSALVSNTNVTAALPPYTNRSGVTIPIAYRRDMIPGDFDPTTTGRSTPYPYMVSTEVSSPQEVLYGGVTRSAIKVQFAVFATGPSSNASSVMLAVNTALDDQILTLSSGQDYDCRRETDPMNRMVTTGDKSMGKNEQGAEMWRCTTDYIYAIRNLSLNPAGCS